VGPRGSRDAVKKKIIYYLCLLILVHMRESVLPVEIGITSCEGQRVFNLKLQIAV